MSRRIVEDDDDIRMLPFVVLCDFLAGASLEDLRVELRATSEHVEALLRAALLAYGFASSRSQRSRERETRST